MVPVELSLTTIGTRFQAPKFIFFCRIGSYESVHLSVFWGKIVWNFILKQIPVSEKIERTVKLTCVDEINTGSGWYTGTIGKGYMHGGRAANVHSAILTANCRGRYCCRVNSPEDQRKLTAIRTAAVQLIMHLTICTAAAMQVNRAFGYSHGK